AEQVSELNRLLSGEDDDSGEESSLRQKDDAHHEETRDTLTPELDSKNALDAEGCPWLMFINEDDGVPYYYNHITGECLWEPPEKFHRFHQDQPQQDLQQLDELNVEKEKLELPVIEDIADPQDEPADSTLYNGMPDNTASQVVITPDFEEKVRQAIATVSNTPVGSSRLVLIHTPTIQQLAPRSEGDNISARASARPLSGSNSTRLGGSSRPSSGTPSTTVIPSRLDTVLPSTEASSTLEKGITVSVAGNEHHGEVAEALVDELHILTEQVDEGRFSVIIQTSSVQESRATADSTEVTSEEKAIFNEATRDTDEEKLAENQRMVLESAEETTNQDGDNCLDEANNAHQDSLEATRDMNAEVDVVVEGEEATVIAEERSDKAALEQRNYIAALTLQCMARGFVARRRVKNKRDERQQENAVGTANIRTSEDVNTITAEPPAVTQAGENKENVSSLHNLPVHETYLEESPDNPAPSSPPEGASISNVYSTVPLPSGDQQTSAVSSRRATSSRIEALPNTPNAFPSASSSSTSTKKQHSTVSTRLPSVLDVTRYFPQRCDLISSHVDHAISSTTSQAAIIRKRVDLSSSLRVQHAPQQETKDHEKLLEMRRREEEHFRHAQIIEYQRFYTESRKEFGAEKQRLQEEKQIRDQQHRHEAEAEKRARIQSQHKRDAARTRTITPVNSTDPLVWEYIKIQGQPNEKTIRQFREALTQTLSSTEFPKKMRTERARELQERIKRLQRASWAVDSQLEAVELRLLSELNPLTDRQRPLQAKYAAKLRCRLERMLASVQSWQHVLDGYDENDSISSYWNSIQALYASSSAIISSDESRRQYALNSWRGAPGGGSLLHIAAWNGWEKHVQLLIDEGADVNLIDSSASYRTPLHEACRAGHVPVVELLLRSGARLDAVDVSGDSPLHVACRAGWTRVVRVLLMAADDIGEERDPRALDKHALTLEEYFNMRNGKGRRAIDVATLPSLVEELHGKT
ncbi:hypothetical protein L915_05752, partial [Phytophthora nicotianae]